MKLEALVPLNFTAEAEVNPDPVNTTLLPTGPDAGEKLLMVGAGVGAVDELSTLARRAVATLAESEVKKVKPVSA